MNRKDEVDQTFDIPVAERKYFEETNPKLQKRLLLSLPVLLLLFSIAGLRLSSNLKLSSLINIDIQNANNKDQSILGHLPYNEISKHKLVDIEPNIKVHIDMRDSLLKVS